jgi:hypothetical protein
MDSLRADEERLGGVIHKPMFERLFLCDFAMADLTTANANVFYELGIRHALRPYNTVPAAAKGSRLPFDLRPVRVQSHYEVDEVGRPAAAAADSQALREILRSCTGVRDSPVYQYLDSLVPPVPDPNGIEAFRDRLAAVAQVRRRFREARKSGAPALASFEAGLGDLAFVEPAVALDLLLAYRAGRGLRPHDRSRGTAAPGRGATGSGPRAVRSRVQQGEAR